MSSSTQESKSNDIIIDIPPNYLIDGKSLLIEEYFELFIDGYHLSKQAHFIKHIHQLCLIDTQQQQQDRKSINQTDQLQSDNHNQGFTQHLFIREIFFDRCFLGLVQIIIQFPSQTLINGKTIQIEEFSGINQEKILGNFQDLFHQSNNEKCIEIKLSNGIIQRGNIILINKDNVSVMTIDEYENGRKHHLINNQFAKQDHLQSNNLMEITIELPPEFFHQGQTIILTKEDPQLMEQNFPYHRNSKGDLHTHQ